MSRLFASILMRSSKISGSLSDIDFVDGFNLGKRVGRASFQSTWSLESWLSQNARSSASDRNSGVFLVLLINDSLLSVHVARGNYAYPGIGGPEGKGDMQLSGIIGHTKSMKSPLFLTMPGIFQYQEWLVKENLLCFGLANAVFVHALARVPLAPLKAGYLGPVDHECILPSYTGRRPDGLQVGSAETGALCGGFAKSVLRTGLGAPVAATHSHSLDLWPR